ncbi:MAG: hemerythrin domain-containing protein [Desulfovibrio sp.]|jgi:hemerythrin-like domain-containing protein|nr:hemerythrin domain-containing protein [Desulfovibrio sp.]
MTATEDLRAEHEGILRMLAILEAVAVRLGDGKDVPAEHLAGMLDFLKTFADKCHHGKEEDILFPALEAAGLARDSGPIGVMLREHTIGRGHIRAMALALELMEPGGARAPVESFRAEALAYVELLAQHIAKENNVLFVMAERLLGEDALTRMHGAFERLERERIGPGRHEAFHAMLDDYSAQYLA